MFPRDFQRKRVYDWEHEFLSPISRELRKEGIVDYARLICTTYGIKNIKGVVFPERGPALFDFYHSKIHLPPWALNTWLVSHELAHHFTYSIHRRMVPLHGAEFVGWHIQIMSDHGNKSLKTLHTSAKMRKLRVILP